MTTSTPVTRHVPTKPRSSGVGPFGMFGTLIAFACMIITVILLTFVSTPSGVAFFLLSGLVLGALVGRDRHDQSVVDKVGARIWHHHKVKTGAATFLPGTITELGSHLVPGVASKSILTEDVDMNGTPYAMLTYPQTGHHVVAIQANPDGASLVDDATIEARVVKYGEWLSSLAYEPNLVQAAITVEIAADQLPGLQLELESNTSPDASELATTVFAQMLESYPLGGSTSQATIGLTFSSPAGLDKAGRKDFGAAATRQRLSTRLAPLIADLPGTGAGPCSLMSADDVMEVVRCAYNPGDRALYQALRAKGQDRPVMKWSSCGPTAHEDAWSHYRHGDGVSVTWEKTGFTSSLVTSRAMAPLLQENAAIPVLRVTWLYKPISPAVAGIIAENDHNNADHRRINAKKPSARVLRDVDKADMTRRAEADGASLLNFATLVTATVFEVEDIPQAKAAAEAAIEHMGPASRLHLRRRDATQDSSFAAGIAVLGLVTDAHLKIPTSVRTGM